MQTIAREHSRTVVEDNGIATLTIANGHPLNILGTPSILELVETIGELRSRSDARVLVLRGTGDRAFIGGADINEMSALDPGSARAFIQRLRSLCDAIRDFPQPVIARLSGWCLGGGLEVALSCDLRIGADSSRYGMPEIKVGIPSVIHAALLPHLVGMSAATWLLMTGEPVDADTAYAWGLIHRLVPLGDLDQSIAQTASALAGLGEQVVRQQKRMLRSWETLPVGEAIDRSVQEFGSAFATGEPSFYMEQFKNRTRQVSEDPAR